MAEDFGLKIALHGGREFKRAITEINSSFRVLGSEMKLVDAQFKRSDDVQAKYVAKDTGRLETAVGDLGDEMDTSGEKALSFGDVLKANLPSEDILAGVKAIGIAIKAVGRGFVDAMKDGVQYNAMMESYTSSFTTMLGDEPRFQLIADLKAELPRPRMRCRILTDAIRTLMSFVISARMCKSIGGCWEMSPRVTKQNYPPVFGLCSGLLCWQTDRSGSDADDQRRLHTFGGNLPQDRQVDC